MASEKKCALADCDHVPAIEGVDGDGKPVVYCACHIPVAWFPAMSAEDRVEYVKLAAIESDSFTVAFDEKGEMILRLVEPEEEA